MIMYLLSIVLLAVSLSPLKNTAHSVIRITSITLFFIVTYKMTNSINCAFTNNVVLFNGLVNVSVVSDIFQFIILSTSVLALIPWLHVYSFNNKMATVPTETYYSVFVIFTIIGSLILLNSEDLITVYISIELQSFAVYVLSALYKESETATYAGLLYFLLGALSSCLILLGGALIFKNVGQTDLSSIWTVLTTKHQTTEIYLGFTILITGFFFKVTAAPFHNWGPDVYDGVPTIVTTWIAVLPKISILGLLLELTSNTTIDSVIPIYSDIMPGSKIIINLFIIVSFISLIIGAVVGIAQFRIKRILAYSTINHVGFIILALAIPKEISIEAFIIYVFIYSITSLNTFIILLAIGYRIINNITYTDINTIRMKSLNEISISEKARYNILDNIKSVKNNFTRSIVTLIENNKSRLSDLKDNNVKDKKDIVTTSDIEYISDVSGSYKIYPALSISLIACMFSITGVPPIAGFFAKFSVLIASIAEGYYFMCVTAVIVSVISGCYYMSIVIEMSFKNINKNISDSNITSHNNPLINDNITVDHSYIISIITLSLIFYLAYAD